ncbi:MAG: metallophosphoesterase [Thermoanaerobaculaceae bacterium]|nr:metallophosphoesterase [Thermoanaerobaculaceae bacterium]
MEEPVPYGRTERLLFVGDIHATEAAAEELRQTLNFISTLAWERKPSGVILLGDVFDGPSTPAERLLISEFLRTISGLIIIIKGDHDVEADLDALSCYPRIRVFSVPRVIGFGPVDLLLVPWPTKEHLIAQSGALESGDIELGKGLGTILYGMATTRERPERPLVVAGHLELDVMQSGDRLLTSGGVKVTEWDLDQLGATAVFLGHIHTAGTFGKSGHIVGSARMTDHGNETHQPRVLVLTVSADGESTVESIYPYLALGN